MIKINLPKYNFDKKWEKKVKMLNINNYLNYYLFETMTSLHFILIVYNKLCI